MATKNGRRAAKQGGATAKAATRANGGQAKFPRHPVERVLRIPRAILDQNAGRDASDEEAASYLGVRLSGTIRMEISSAIKYTLLERPTTGQLRLTDVAKQILRPQGENDRLDGLRKAVLAAPVFGDVYRHYRGEYLPDPPFFDNALTDSFGVPSDLVAEFKAVFLESLASAQLVEEHGGKQRLLDVSQQLAGAVAPQSDESLRKAGRAAGVSATDSCFVVMPFASPLGDHYRLIFEPAIRKAGLNPVRADADIFGTGRVMDQIWDGIQAAKVLVAELTARNPNVFYELGIAHALDKPVVLISADEGDVPFDVRHIRVLYYDVNDPFWGEKLLNKVAENVVSAIRNPAEATFRGRTGVA